MEGKEDSIAAYSLPVHRSLMERDVFFGIGHTALFGIVVATVILASMVSVYCVLLGVAALLACRLLCRDEPMLIEFLVQNLGESDLYRG